jgi:hypothetical protein
VTQQRIDLFQQMRLNIAAFIDPPLSVNPDRIAPMYEQARF